MKLKRFLGNPLLEKNPKNFWEAGSVLNPNVIFDDGIFRMTYRATDNEKIGEIRNDVSSIGYAESTDGIHFKRFTEPIIKPDKSYESLLGCEDPRVTKIDGTYYMFYTAVSGADADNKIVRIALATSKDFKIWTKHGVIGPNSRTKAATLFPEKINGKYVVLYTWMSDSPLSTIMYIEFEKIEDLITKSGKLFSDNLNNFENNWLFKYKRPVMRGPEVGATPIKTKNGWLLIYCPANVTDHKEWTIGAALLDLNNPKKVLGETSEPILKPETVSELNGVTNFVTFPSGAVVVNEELYVYYGSGDQGCCLATCKFEDLISSLV